MNLKFKALSLGSSKSLSYAASRAEREKQKSNRKFRWKRRKWKMNKQGSKDRIDRSTNINSFRPPPCPDSRYHNILVASILSPNSSALSARPHYGKQRTSCSEKLTKPPTQASGMKGKQPRPAALRSTASCLADPALSIETQCSRTQHSVRAPNRYKTIK